MTTTEIAKVADRDRIRFPTPESSTGSSPDFDDDYEDESEKEEEYEVERIVCYRKRRNDPHLSYLVKWKNYSKEESTWERVENLVNCNRLIEQCFATGYPSQKKIKRMNRRINDSFRLIPAFEEMVLGRLKIRKFFGELGLNSTSFFQSIDAFENKLSSEFKSVVRCLVKMDYCLDPGMLLRAKNYKVAMVICKKRRRQLRLLREKETAINKLEKCLVRIENNVDLDTLPDFKYVTDLVPFRDVNIRNEPLIWCECEGSCTPQSKCCPQISESKFAYDKNSRLRFSVPIGIFECNSKCPCPPTCRNRVVQNGRRFPLCIFKTLRCGWGVKTLSPIRKGEFVCEYVGEVIPDEEAVVRDVSYGTRNLHYLFDMDFAVDMVTSFCIDATSMGNLARFMNHSCSPNLSVHAVWIDCLDARIHRLAFFAKRDIREGEEINFDYTVNNRTKTESPTAPPMISNLRCRCNAPNCRQALFAS